MKMDHLRRKTMFPFGKVICLWSCRQHTKFSYHVARAIAIIKTIRFNSLVVLAVSCPKKEDPTVPPLGSQMTVRIGQHIIIIIVRCLLVWQKAFKCDFDFNCCHWNIMITTQGIKSGSQWQVKSNIVISFVNNKESVEILAFNINFYQ